MSILWRWQYNKALLTWCQCFTKHTKNDKNPRSVTLTGSASLLLFALEFAVPLLKAPNVIRILWSFFWLSAEKPIILSLFLHGLAYDFMLRGRPWSHCKNKRHFWQAWHVFLLFRVFFSILFFPSDTPVFPWVAALWHTLYSQPQEACRQNLYT